MFTRPRDLKIGCELVAPERLSCHPDAEKASAVDPYSIEDVARDAGKFVFKPPSMVDDDFQIDFEIVKP